MAYNGFGVIVAIVASMSRSSTSMPCPSRTKLQPHCGQAAGSRQPDHGELVCSGGWRKLRNRFVASAILHYIRARHDPVVGTPLPGHQWGWSLVLDGHGIEVELRDIEATMATMTPNPL